MFDPTSLIHTPTQTNDGISQIDHDTGNLIPLFFSKNLTGSKFRFKTWLTTNRVDNFKSKLITIMEAFKNWTTSLTAPW